MGLDVEAEQHEPNLAVVTRFGLAPIAGLLTGGADSLGDSRPTKRTVVVPKAIRSCGASCARSGPGRCREGLAAQAVDQNPPSPVEIQPGMGCHGPVIPLYPLLARKRGRDRRQGTERDLLFSVDLVSFRASIDSEVIQAGGLGGPRISCCLFVQALARSESLKPRWLTQDGCFNRSAVPHRSEEFVRISKFGGVFNFNSDLNFSKN